MATKYKPVEFTPDYDPATLWVPGTIGIVIVIGGVAIREGYVVLGWIIVTWGCVLAVKYIRLKMKQPRSPE